MLITCFGERFTHYVIKILTLKRDNDFMILLRDLTCNHCRSDFSNPENCLVANNSVHWTNWWRAI